MYTWETPSPPSQYAPSRGLSPTAVKQLNCCPLTRNFIDAAQWLSKCLSIHGTATQSRFTLGIKHRLQSPSLYQVVQGHCRLNSRRGCSICLFSALKQNTDQTGKQHSNGDACFKKWLKCTVPWNGLPVTVKK